MDMELNEYTTRQKRYKGICKQCGKEVSSYYKSQLPTFCSHKCSNQWKWENIRERKKYIVFKCACCGKEIKIESSDHRIKVGQKIWFCNHDCESKYRISIRTMKECPICGKKFFNNKTQTCSRECGREWMKLKTYKRKNNLNEISYNEYLKLIEKEKVEDEERKSKCKLVVMSNGYKRYYDKDFVCVGREKEYHKEYNKDHSKQRYKKHAERMKTDVVYCFKQKMRNFIYSSFKRKNISKVDRTENILGCSLEYLRQYISSKFKKGMTIDNYGKWQIDHIIPLSTAKSVEDVVRLCHYTNLQPLWASENRAKSNKILHN